jgi:hypothetical protein
MARDRKPSGPVNIAGSPGHQFFDASTAGTTDPTPTLRNHRGLSREDVLLAVTLIL